MSTISSQLAALATEHNLAIPREHIVLLGKENGDSLDGNGYLVFDSDPLAYPPEERDEICGLLVAARAGGVYKGMRSAMGYLLLSNPTPADHPELAL